MLRKSVELERELERQKKLVISLGKKLQNAEDKKSDLVDAVRSAVSEGVGEIKFPPVKTPRKSRSKSRVNSRSLLAMYSDFQLAKVTPDYSSEIARLRSDEYAARVVEAGIEAGIEKVSVAALGDIVEGELIFPGQHWLIDSSLYRQVTVDGPEMVGNFLRVLLAGFREVNVYWVIGNHGRLGGRSARDMNPESNADRMLGNILRQLFEGEKRLNFRVCDNDDPSAGYLSGKGSAGKGERNWYMIPDIGAYRPLLLHGDQFNCQQGIPFYSFSKLVGGWASGAITERFDDVLCGHWHQSARVPLNSRNVYVNGSPESFNTYAQERFASMTPPGQTILTVDEDRGRVASEEVVRLGLEG